jgi:hypothetical protein
MLKDILLNGFINEINALGLFDGDAAVCLLLVEELTPIDILEFCIHILYSE